MKLAGDIKVGLFVLMGLVLAGLVVFLIGEERRFFNRSVVYKAEFADVAGLKHGAPVEMGGVRIGEVEKVGYEHPADSHVLVVISVVSTEADRIRQDSIAKIVPKGVLGDRMVQISRGSEDQPQLEGGAMISSEEPSDLLDRVGNIAGTAEETMHNVSDVAKSLNDAQLHKDIRESATSLNLLLKQLTAGEGYPSKLLTSKEESERISRIIENLDETSKELALTLREVRLATTRVNRGPGFAHDLLFGTGPTKEIAQVGDAAEEIALTLRSIRKGDGFAHDVLFGGDDKTNDALQNITVATADLRDIMRGLKDGKGTLGALLVDPSIYEDLKRVLGNVERNSVLRAIVRYSIKQDKEPPKANVAEGGKD